MRYYREKREEILKNTPPLSQYRIKLGSGEKETSLNVFTTWELSFQQLESITSENCCEVKLLTLFAFLDNKDISEQLFAESLTLIGGKNPKVRNFLHCSMLLPIAQVANGIAILRDLSLLQGFAREPDKFYHSSLHPLVKDWIRLRTSRLIGQQNTYMAATLLSRMLSSSWRNSQFELPLSAKQTVLSHIVALEEAHEELFVLQVEVPAKQDILNEYLAARSWFAKFLFDNGLYQLAETIFRQIAQQKQCLGLEHPDRLRSKAKLVSTYRNQGRWKETEELILQVMETRKKVLGLEHPDTLKSMHNISVIFWCQDRRNQAVQLMTEVVQLRRQKTGPEHSDTILSIPTLQRWQNEMESSCIEEVGIK